METRGGRGREVEHLRPARARSKSERDTFAFYARHARKGHRDASTALPDEIVDRARASRHPCVRVYMRACTRSARYRSIVYRTRPRYSAFLNVLPRAGGYFGPITGRVTVRSAIYALNNALCLPLAEPRVL